MATPTFNQRTGADNPFNGIDVGDVSAPTFVDIDGDGDLDAIVGDLDGNMFYFENTGSATNPVYEWQTDADNPFNGLYVIDPGADNTFNGPYMGRRNNPTFGDIDGDGDLDAVVGDFDGNMLYFENTGSATNPVYKWQTDADNPFKGLYVGRSNNPTLADIDGDGDLDAVVGGYDGTLNYFENTGSATNPVYERQTSNNNPFNGIDVGFNSTPTLADIDGDGDLDAVVGESDGTLNYFENTGSTTNPFYRRQTGADNPFNGIDVGSNSRPTLADIDGDGDLDVVVGESDGTLNYFENNQSPAAVEHLGTPIMPGTGGTDGMGYGGADSLFGSQGDDLLEGGRGSDVLVGGDGADTLIGGGGSDTFLFTSDQGIDIIRDFTDQDRIVIDASELGGIIVNPVYDSSTGELSVTRQTFDIQITKVQVGSISVPISKPVLVAEDITLAVLEKPSGFDVNTDVSIV